MKTLLLYPNPSNQVLGWGDLGAIAEPLALEYLAAAGRQDGHEVLILDLRLHPDALDTTLHEYKPDVVGVTGYSMHVLSGLALCRRVKALRPACWTVAGGHHATLLPEDYFASEVDFVVSGEGVRPFRQLLRALECGSPPGPIPGVWMRAGDSFGFGGEQGPFSLDDLPLPDRSLNLDDRETYFIDWMKPIALLRTTVGCPYRCSFCSLWKVMEGRYYKRDVERVVAELATIQEENVFLVDDEPFINGPRMLELANAISRAGIKKRYFAYCRVDSFLRQPELMQAWRRIGLERLFFGIDGITGAELSDYNKRIKVAQIEEGLRVARAQGFDVFAQFIVNPSYTRREFKQLIRFIEHNKIAYPSFTVLTPLPGTEDLATFNSIVEKQANGRPNWDLFDLQNPVTRTALPLEEFKEEYRGLHKVFAGAYRTYQEPARLPDKPHSHPEIRSSSPTRLRVVY